MIVDNGSEVDARCAPPGGTKVDARCAPGGTKVDAPKDGVTISDDDTKGIDQKLKAEI